MEHLHFNIYICNDCTRQCEECYYPQGNQIMSIELAEQLVKWIIKLCKNEEAKHLRVHFLGGEPTLHHDILRYLMIRLQTEKPKDIKWAEVGGFVIFTNGDPLDEYKLSDYKSMDAKIALNPTNDPLEEIERKIKLIKSVCGGCSLSISLTPYNLERLLDLVNLALKYNAHPKMSRLYNGALIPGYLDMYTKQMHKVLEALLSHNKPIWPNFIVESTIATWKGPKNPNFCGKCHLIIDPDGTVRSCTADMDTICGTIKNENPHMKDYKCHQRRSAKDIRECDGCEWITWCQAGCPFVRKLTYNTYNKKTPFCSATKELFPKLMKLARKWEKRKDN